ncbi:uncharacterized protein LOC111642644 [Centruroides sculpturatus]|uniref:uncharacterized protein LOC111642644 n=1 Tax=Centruroides sculpturatus TaxID=218467 RepID=UPI000C6EE668|nr:uncharacterized protein LOC111642644 [Centruroides sculpturatus]
MAVRYQDEVLEPIVKLFAAAVGPGFVLMDDNARPHRAALVDDYLENEGFMRMDWLAYSQDLNPIENLWDALGRAGYAEDTTLLLSHVNHKVLQDRVNGTLLRISDWCVNNKLIINYNKCNVLVFPKGNILKKGPSIKIDNIKIKNATSVRYLGIVFDPKLNWTEHVHYVYEKAVKVAQALKTISRNQWGYGPSSSRILYTAVIEPIVTYGAEIWGTSVTRVHIKRKLLSIQRIMAINIAKAYKTAPTEALLVINRTPPIDIKIREILIRFNLIKLANNQINQDHFNAIVGKEEFAQDLISLAATIATNGFDKCSPNPIHPSFTPSVSLETSNSDDQDICIFTDGSKTDQGVGSAFVAYKGKVCLYQMYRKLAPHCTINQAESLAISNAIDWISNTNHNWTNHNFRIYTDSRIALQQIAKINTTLPIVKKCLGNLQALKKGNINVYFHWIKGHSGSAGNDRADLLARCASAKSNSCTYNKISSKHLNNLIHNIILKTWQVRWDNGSTGKPTHCFLPCPTDSMLHPRYPTFQLT